MLEKVHHPRMGVSSPAPRAATAKLNAAPAFANIIRGIFQACFLGYKLDERSQGHGYMTEALTAAIDYLFTTQRLHRIQANYMPHNQRSAAVLRRLGFTIEGTARNYLFIGGQWRDHVLTSLVNPDPLVAPKER